MTMGSLGGTQEAWVLVAVAAMAVMAAATQTIRLWWHRAAPAWRLHARARRAAEGELHAEKFLARLGYDIRAKQVACSWTVMVDGKAAAIDLRADLIVAREGRTFVAEVKTGALAPRIESSATRRQLLEYRCAFDVDGVLLVDAESERVSEIVFPLACSAEQRRGSAPLLWMAIGIAIGAAAMYALR